MINGDKLEEIKQKVNNDLNSNWEGVLARVNDRLINQALKKLKPRKRDAIFDTISDCYLNGPMNLNTHITNLMVLFQISCYHVLYSHF